MLKDPFKAAIASRFVGGNGISSIQRETIGAERFALFWGGPREAAAEGLSAVIPSPYAFIVLSCCKKIFN